MQPKVPYMRNLLSQGLLNEVSSLRYLNAKPSRALTPGCNVGCAFSESPRLLVLLLVLGCPLYRPWPGSPSFALSLLEELHSIDAA